MAMINDVMAKQPYREDLIDFEESSLSPSPLKKKPLFLPNCSYDFSDKTAAQISKERLEYLNGKILSFSINKSLEETAQVLFWLKGEYNEAKSNITVKKSAFSKMVLSRLPA